MQTPTRKIGKYAHLKPDPHLTQAKYDELKSKHDRLKTYSQPRAAAEVKRLAEMGDFSENAAYQIAKGRLRGINQRILDIADHLKRAIIIQPNRSGRILLGSTFTVLVNGKEKTYTLLGSSETDPLRGIISHNSPIGEALLNKSAGDIVRVRLNDREIEYKVMKVD